MNETRFDVVIIGGGIAGLSAAYAVLEEAEREGRQVQCAIVEADSRCGGKIHTDYVDDYVVETGPDSFLSTKPEAVELCTKLGLGEQLINTNAQHSQTFCFAKGRMRELPQGLVAFVPTRMGALFSGGLISPMGMLRMGWERFVPKREPGREESLAGFFRRRLGGEAFDYFIEPLVAGIYAGHADELSLEATFPRFHHLEQRYGSLIKGIRHEQRQRRAAPSGKAPARSMFTTLRGGLGDLPRAIVAHLERRGVTFFMKRCVEALVPARHADDTATVRLAEGTPLRANDVVVATPTYVAAGLLRPHHAEIADLLAGIAYASTATISLAFPAESVADRIRGFGFVVPRVEQRSLIAATWTSLKWSHRSPNGATLARCYVGGQGREQILERDDAELTRYVRDELREMAGIECAPVLTRVQRWDRAMPQYVCGHLERIQRLGALMQELPSVHLTGAGYEGLGIPDCIKHGMKVGRAVAHSRTAGVGATEA